MIINPDEVMTQRLMKLNYHWSEERVRRNWRDLPKSSQGLLLDAYFRPDDQLFFVFQYVRFYLSTRENKVIETQIYWTLKYALAIAPIVSALPLGEYKPFKSKWVGELVEYSFASVRDRSKPDPADYDLDVLRGAVIVRLFTHHLPTGDSIELARGIGASWEDVRDNWVDLKDKDLGYVLQYLTHLKEGGSIHLADGVL